MSIQNEITRINGNIANAYTAVGGKGGTLPSTRNSANLSDAINSIPSGGDDDYLPIGGRIFYDNGFNDAEYQFFDANKTEIFSYNISDLENAVYYKVTGVPRFDRFYVFDNTSHGSGDFEAVDGIVSNIMWGMHGISTQYEIYYNDWDFCDKVNSSKALSALALAKGNEEDSIPTIWQYINHCNATRLNGCGDWFILSNGGHMVLASSGLVNWYFDLYLWSSVEDDEENAHTVSFNIPGWGPFPKNSDNSCFAARAF